VFIISARFDRFTSNECGECCWVGDLDVTNCRSHLGNWNVTKYDVTAKNRNTFLLHTEIVASRALTMEQQPAGLVQTCTQFLAPSKCTSRCHDVRAHPPPLPLHILACLSPVPAPGVLLIKPRFCCLQWRLVGGWVLTDFCPPVQRTCGLSKACSFPSSFY